MQDLIAEQRDALRLDAMSTERLATIANRYSNVVAGLGEQGQRHWRDATAFGLAAAQVIADRRLGLCREPANVCHSNLGLTVTAC